MELVKPEDVPTKTLSADDASFEADETQEGILGDGRVELVAAETNDLAHSASESARGVHEQIVTEIAQLRATKAQINDRLRELVPEELHWARVVRVIEGKQKSKPKPKSG